ncbi:hypothetical protein D3C72_2022060 [compost metagenome]
MDRLVGLQVGEQDGLGGVKDGLGDTGLGVLVEHLVHGELALPLGELGLLIGELDLPGFDLLGIVQELLLLVRELYRGGLLLAALEHAL